MPCGSSVTRRRFFEQYDHELSTEEELLRRPKACCGAERGMKICWLSALAFGSC